MDARTSQALFLTSYNAPLESLDVLSMLGYAVVQMEQREDLPGQKKEHVRTFRLRASEVDYSASGRHRDELGAIVASAQAKKKQS